MVRVIEQKPDTSAESSPAAIAPEENTQEQNAIAADSLGLVGSATLKLSKGTLRINEPSFQNILDARLKTAEWVRENNAGSDPAINNMLFVAYVVIEAATRWEPRHGTESLGITYEQYTQLSARDLNQVSKALEPYLVPEDNDKDPKQD